LAAQPKVQARPRRWLTPVTLVLLEEESSHGYKLIERMEEEFGFEGINPGSVYRTLRQMEHEGLCRSEWETPATEGGPPRRRCTPSRSLGKPTWRPGQKRVSRSA
jgi:PadR family transcriptional regulator, regulatory protein PadR